MARVTPSPETINDEGAYEYFAGHDRKGKAVWTDDFNEIKPLMCITDGWPTVAKMDSYILEADELTGPWRMVSYLEDFGEQAYFLNFPSKFISDDGLSLWLCYSANFSPSTNNSSIKTSI